MGYKETYYIEMDDHVMILQDGCVKIIRFEDFISGISLGGFSVCAAWLNCVSGIGDFIDDETPVNNPPTMEDLNIALQNRGVNAFTSDSFLSKYYDEENDAFGKIIITGGDVSGYKLNGNPVTIGMMIPADQLANLTYEAKNQDGSYTQDLFFDAYDENNVKAQST